MHGVKRTKPNSSQPTSDERATVIRYKHLNQDLTTRHASKQYADPQSLSLSTELLKLNPEHVTAWSFRRHCLLALHSDIKHHPQAFNHALQAELPLTLASFRRNPKAYPIWEHRKWVLNHITEPDWQAEMKLLEKMFKLDGRNFHAWDYRRYLISKLRINNPPSTLDDDELEFSRQQIELSFSNFSAWHYRSKLIESQLNQLHHHLDSSNKDNKLAKELEWVRGALWIDPDDQSGWLYHRWLLSQTSNHLIRSTEFRSIEELLEIEPDSKWAMTALLFHEPNKYSKYIDRLLVLDPLRKERYIDLAHKLS